MRVVFPYFAQLHQILHSLPIAAEMALRHRDVEVQVAAAHDSHLEFIGRMLAEHAPDAPLRVHRLQLPLLSSLPHKKRTMFKNRAYFRGFDAIVTPERTSEFLRRVVPASTRLVWTRHGAGDRAIGFARDVSHFDYVLMAGPKIEQRLLAEGLIRPGHYTRGVYAKFDWLQGRSGTPLFDNGRPTVLYNPHFEPTLSSWPAQGLAVLEHFAESTRYNLIFAPHVRLFDPPTADKYAPFQRYLKLPHLRIDLGSVRSVDMSYVNAADLYLGDVSSQVAEFLCRPRPCLFLNAHGVAWQGSADYRFWTLGGVLDSLSGLDEQIERAFSSHADYVARQRQYIEDTFGIAPGQTSAARAAEAIVGYLSAQSSAVAEARA